MGLRSFPAQLLRSFLKAKKKLRGQPCATPLRSYPYEGVAAQLSSCAPEKLRSFRAPQNGGFLR